MNTLGIAAVRNVVEFVFVLLAALIAFSLSRLDRSEPAYLWLTLVCLSIATNQLLYLIVDFTNLIHQYAAYTCEYLNFILCAGLWTIFWGYWLQLDRLQYIRPLRRFTFGLVLAWGACVALQNYPLFLRVVPSRADLWLQPVTVMLRLLLSLILLWIFYRGYRRDRAGALIALFPMLLTAVWFYSRELLRAKIVGHLSVLGFRVDAAQIVTAITLTFITVLMLRRFLRSLRKRGAMEREIEEARQVQQILIPEVLPDLPGFVLESEYLPAQQVGGDFFQVIALNSANTPSADGLLAIVGDVSGKGLKAAMTVALIVGTLRTLAEYESEPSRLLEGLNRRLHGRMSGGFATCIVLRLKPDGVCTLANAGHLPPYLNGEEFPVTSSLPLGITLDADYSQQNLTLGPGDQLTLYTDGVLEARDAAGSLFGFERLKSLLSRRPAAAKVAEAACVFGQDDDITVLTLGRLGAVAGD